MILNWVRCGEDRHFCSLTDSRSPTPRRDAPTAAATSALGPAAARPGAARSPAPPASHEQPRHRRCRRPLARQRGRESFQHEALPYVLHRCGSHRRPVRPLRSVRVGQNLCAPHLLDRRATSAPAARLSLLLRQRTMYFFMGTRPLPQRRPPVAFYPREHRLLTLIFSDDGTLVAARTTARFMGKRERSATTRKNGALSRRYSRPARRRAIS